MGRMPGSIDYKKQVHVLETATQMLAEHGRSLSLAAIARRSGVSRQTLYNHFGGKAALLDALSSDREETQCPCLVHLAEELPETVLAAYARSLLTWAYGPRQVTAMRARVHAPDRCEQDDDSWSLISLQPALRNLAEFLRRETHAGRLDVDSPRQAAELFLDLVLAGVQLRIVAGRGDPPSVETIERRAQLFVRAHGPRRAAIRPSAASHPPGPRAAVWPHPLSSCLSRR